MLKCSIKEVHFWWAFLMRLDVALWSTISGSSSRQGPFPGNPDQSVSDPNQSTGETCCNISIISGPWWNSSTWSSAMIFQCQQWWQSDDSVTVRLARLPLHCYEGAQGVSDQSAIVTAPRRTLVQRFATRHWSLWCTAESPTGHRLTSKSKGGLKSFQAWHGLTLTPPKLCLNNDRVSKLVIFWNQRHFQLRRTSKL